MIRHRSCSLPHMRTRHVHSSTHHVAVGALRAWIDSADLHGVGACMWCCIACQTRPLIDSTYAHVVHHKQQQQTTTTTSHTLSTNQEQAKTKQKHNRNQREGQESNHAHTATLPIFNTHTLRCTSRCAPSVAPTSTTLPALPHPCDTHTCLYTCQTSSVHIACTVRAIHPHRRCWETRSWGGREEHQPPTRSNTA